MLTDKQSDSQKNIVSASPVTKWRGEGGGGVKEGGSTVHWKGDVRGDLTTSILIFFLFFQLHTLLYTGESGKWNVQR